MSPTRTAKIQKQAIPNIGDNVEQPELLGISVTRTLWSISRQLVRVTYQPSDTPIHA